MAPVYKPFTYDPRRAFRQVTWGGGSKPLEVELQEMQQIMIEQTNKLASTIMQDGFISIDGDIDGSAYTYTANGQLNIEWALTIPAFTAISDGDVIEVPTGITKSGSSTLSNPQNSAADIYLTTWVEELTPTSSIKQDGNLASGADIPNDLIDPRYGVETSRRMQRVVDLVITNDVAPQPTIPGAKFIKIGSYDADGNLTASPTMAEGGAGGKGRVGSVVVAASNSSDADKKAADFVCTGTDDHIVINEAINSLYGAGQAGGGIVTLLAGVYSLGDSIIPKNYLILEGVGLMTRLAVGASASQYITMIDNKAQSYGACIRNMAIDGTLTSQLGSTAISLKAPGAVPWAGFLVENVAITNTKNTTTTPRSTVLSGGGRIHGCLIQNCNAPMEVTDFVVRENEFLESTIRVNADCTISDNTFKTANNTGIAIELWGSSIIKNNRITKYHTGIMSNMGSADRCVIEGNTLIDVYQLGMEVYGDDNLISGNFIIGPGSRQDEDYGVFIGGYRNTLRGNKISGYQKEVEDVGAQTSVDGVLACNQEFTIISTSPVEVATAMPRQGENQMVEVSVYFRVTAATTNVNVTIVYTDGSGAQTLVLIPTQAYAIGSYAVPAARIVPAGLSNISVQTTVSNPIIITAVIKEV